MGDTNVCSTRWNEGNFKLKAIAEEIKGALAQCGMLHIELGYTCHGEVPKLVRGC